MKYIYIENYLSVSREDKFEFIKYLYSFNKFKLVNQKVILNDNSLIIELTKESSSDMAKKSIEAFFKNSDEIKTFFVDKLVAERDFLYLYNDEVLLKKIKI